MKPKTPNIIDVIRNRQLFGSLPAFRDLSTWQGWLVWLKAQFAFAMDEKELVIYQQCTGREKPPIQEPQEVYTIVGRRGGKSFISALTAVFLACFREYRKYLNAGERAVILVLARDRDQAKIVFNYVRGILNAIPPLYALVVAERADEIELDNGVVIMCKTSDFRAIRGLTVACCILDELAFWDSQGVNPSNEIVTALRPSMATIPNSKLLAISTPYAKGGILYEAHRAHFGQDDDSHTLVWVADTRTMNPTVDQDLIQRELEKDPDSARAEWLGQFREDLEAALSCPSLP